MICESREEIMMMKFLDILCLVSILLSSVVSAMFPSLIGPEELIRQLNLFPEKPINVVHGNTTEPAAGPSIVEKRFRFPNLVHTTLPGQAPGHFAGYYKVKRSYAARMFYFFFESRTNMKDPVFLWLSGGPGCGSELALFCENGPVIISEDLSLQLNEFGWDKISNLLYVDQPIGTGFSYTSDARDIRHTEAGVSNDLYNFLQAFFKKHPRFANNDFYITGESYAGHYIPALATRILKGNRAEEGIHIHLKGLAIGNGLTDPAIQFQSYPDYAFYMKLIDPYDHEIFQKLSSLCKMGINSCGTDGVITCAAAQNICFAIFRSIVSTAGNINVYDIRKKNNTVPRTPKNGFSNVVDFLKQKSVRDALGVGNIEFVPCSTKVYEAMVLDIIRNLEVGIPPILEGGIKLLVYAGEYDFLCNWIGNLRWMKEMKWSRQTAFLNSPFVPFVVDGAEAGVNKSHGPLTFLKVHDAGHNVPMDQPKVALEMVKRWIKGGAPAEPGTSVSNASSIWFS